MKKGLIIPVLCLVLSLSSCSYKIIRIACIGDSITEGAGLACQSKTGYPVVLNDILGSKYSVLNSGRSATTLQKKGDFPYWICKEFSNVFAFNPNIVVIKLGTNDTKPQNWRVGNYEKDYQSLIDTLKTLPAKPRIYLCLPAPVFKTKWGINDSTVVHGVIPAITRLAATNHLTVIDLHSKMQNLGANFPDSIHPNENAAREMAKLIASEIKK